MPRSHAAYWTKSALAVVLIAIADLVFYRQPFGVNPGAYEIALSLVVVVALPAVRRDRRALTALAIAMVTALVSLEHPTAVASSFFVLSLGVAVLSPRARRADDVWPWAQRLGVAILRGLVAPLRDFGRLRGKRLRRRRGGAGLNRLTVLALPMAGGLVFAALFAAANPLIATALENLRLPRVDLSRAMFWLLAGTLVWAVLRPSGLRRTIAPPDGRGDLELPGVTPASLLLSLIVFNTLFAVQNGLDVAFLWSHAPLPPSVTLAEYAHRGAYLLIVTAILAGAFVLIALRPGSTTSASPAVRRLVVLFVAQNVLLVASSVLRTLDYVEAYGLTQLRLAALAWMGLVAVGLVLICVRLLQDRGSSWLVNANSAAAALVLLAVGVIDLGAVAATWNARHVREIDGRGPKLDLDYLEALHGAALVPLTELEDRPLPAGQSAAVTATRIRVMTDLERRQANWRTWSWRDARRLRTASQLVARRPSSPAPPKPDSTISSFPAASPSPPPLTGYAQP